MIDPGKYVALGDREFENNWTSTKMNASGQSSDKATGDSVFIAELPASIQKHRRLVRYRIRLAKDNKLIVPEPDDAQPNFAYFVYDGVPAWQGAINPKSADPKLREAVTYSSEVLQRIPVYHFISSKASVEKATWYEPAPWGLQPERNDYKYTGTMVYDGVVYDHVKFRARGGEWRHAMGKNMWKFNFLPGHRFLARDHYGNLYNAKWDKLNLGACIQQGDTGLRGEQGMFEAVGFRLFNLAGMEAPHTHWVHLRIIDDTEESPSDQYAGDFWGLYLATENVDEHFLKEHDLPVGNLYKIEFGRPKTAFNGNPAITNQSDVMQFLRATMRPQPPQPDAWWLENADLSRYYTYRSILECIHHYDIAMGKNYFYYSNQVSKKWIVIPWDIDLSWADHVFGTGQEPFYRAGLLFRSPFKERYQDRLAEIRDLLFNPEQIGMLIDEYAAMISDPKGGAAIADADRAKWDFHPIMASPQVHAKKARQGRFYFANAQNNFGTMLDYMKDYAGKRLEWIDRSLLADYRPLPSPKIATVEPLNFSQAHLKFRIVPGAEAPGVTAYGWRLAEISDTNSPAFNSRQPWKYEINAIWEKELSRSETVEIPTEHLAAGHTYRVRALCKDAAERWSRWSRPVQFTVERR